jgi:hypothetical protein
MTRFLLAFSGALFVGSTGAFFLFVPPALIAAVSITTVALFLVGFTLLFCLSIQVKIQPTLPAETCKTDHILPLDRL